MSMGTDCVAAQMRDESDGGVPQVPPGFASLAAFTLQRVHHDDATKSCTSSSILLQNGGDGTDASYNDKFRRSLRRRPWVNYSRFDDGSDEEEIDSDLFRKDRPSSVRCLPKGVLRGCSECANCQKVIAKWKPDEASMPILDETPVFYPSGEEFKDTLKYIERIRPSAEPYGICRIVPPSSWKPPCLLKEKALWQESKFATRIQQIHKLQRRESTKKIFGHNTIGKKKQKILKTGVCGGDLLETDKPEQCHIAERFGFETGPYFTLESFQKYADEFKDQYFQTSLCVNSHLPNEQSEPSVANIEGEYWRIVERPTEEIEVLYGADLDTTSFGSGFPKASSVSTNSYLEDQYAKSGWNLNNLPRLPGSVLCFESGDIPGVLVPWLYAGMCFSSFCWHVEDHHLYSLNYLHLGAPKVWYGVPGKDASKFEAAMKKHLPDLFEEQPDLLHNLVTQFSPSSLKLEGVPVYRCVQHKGEFVLTFPRAYHSGFNCGFNCAEAVNVAPLDWLPHGQTAIELYREQKRRITLAHDKLLLGAAKEAVRAQWKILFLKNNTEGNLRWKSACGVDGILTRALKARTAVEHTRREFLCCSSRSKKMDAAFDVSDRECAICHYDLHLSAAGCPCCPDKFACLIHARQLCSCAWSTRFFLFRYDISEMNILLNALGGKSSAIHRWGIVDLGLTLSAYMARDSSVVNRVMRGGKQGNQELNLGKLGDCARRYDFSKQIKASIPQASHSQVGKDDEKGALNEAHSREGEKSSHTMDEASVLSRGGHRSSQSSSSDSSSQLPSEENFTSTSGSCSEVKDKSISNSKLTVIRRDKGSSSSTGDVISANDGDHKDTGELLFEETEKEPVLESSKQTTIKLKDSDGTHPVLANSTTDAFILQQNSDNMLPLFERSGDSSNLKPEGYKNQKESIKGSDLLNQQSVRMLPQSASSCPKPVPAATPISHFLAPKEACDSNSTDIDTQLQNPQPLGSRKLHNESVYGKIESLLECDVANRGGLVRGGPGGSQHLSRHVLARCNSMQKGPRVAKVVQQYNCAVEPLEYGNVMSGKLWSTGQAIFPKGYKSRVSYFSILDPMKRCYYICEILDAGLLGPLFMVTVEQCLSEVFIHLSATKCWEMVRERVNWEIRRQHEMKRQHKMARKDLPVLQPPGSLDGLEMFGLSSPAIIQAIEALDHDRVCREYWNYKTHKQATPSSAGLIVEDGVGEQRGRGLPLPTISTVALQGLFKKANTEELLALQCTLSGDTCHNSRQEAMLLLSEEINKRCC